MSRPAEAYILAVDAGTGACKAVVIDARGRVAGRASRTWPYRSPPGGPEGAREFSPAECWLLAAEAVQECLGHPGVQPEQVAAVAVCAQRHGVVLLDRSGGEVHGSPSIDFRGRDAVAQLGEDERWEIFHRTGHWPEAIYLPFRVAWLRRYQPRLAARVRRFLTIDGWLAYRLCGEVACDASQAGDTLLFDVRRLKWAVPSAVGVEVQWCPPLQPPGSVLGTVTAVAAEATGMRAGTPVVLAGADTQCALQALGVTDPGQAALVAGTSAPVQQVWAEPFVDPEARMWTNCHNAPGRWVLEANGRRCGPLLQWSAAALGFCSVSDLLAAAAQASPGAGGVRAYLGPVVSDARRLPTWPVTALLGLDPFAPGEQARPLVARAVLENIAFAAAGNVERLVSLSGHQPEMLHAGGGLAESALWVQMVADASRLPVAAADRDASARGAAVIAARALFGGTASRDLLAPVRVFPPGPAAAATAEARERWQLWYRRLARLQQEVLP